MPGSRGQKVPVAVVTGFLGSGKSTFLLRLARRYRDRRIAWVVNEYSRLDVDGAWLQGEGLAVIPAPGGSLFCACLAASFHRIMGELAARAADGLLDGVVVETSGLTRPGPVDSMLAEFGLGDRLEIASLTAVADAAAFPRVCGVLEAAALQVAACDYVLLNKCDTASDAELAETRARVAALAPGRPVFLTALAAADIDVLRPVRPAAAAPGPWAAVPEAGLSVVCLERRQPVDTRALCAAVEGIGATLLRAKGVLHAGDGFHKVDWDGSRVRCVPVAAAPESPGLALFPRPNSGGPAQNLLRRIHRGDFDLPPDLPDGAPPASR